MKDEDKSFVHGVLLGLAAAAVLLHVWLAVRLAPFRELYAQFGGKIPKLTLFVLSPLWLWAVPVIAASEIAVLAWRRPRRSLDYLVLAGALLVTLLATWHYSQAPIHEMADSIR